MCALLLCNYELDHARLPVQWIAFFVQRRNKFLCRKSNDAPGKVWPTDSKNRACLFYIQIAVLKHLPHFFLSSRISLKVIIELSNGPWFYIFQNVQTISEAYPASYSVRTGGFPGVNRSGREAKQSPSSRLRVRGAVNPLSLYAFVKCWRKTRYKCALSDKSWRKPRDILLVKFYWISCFTCLKKKICFIYPQN